MNDLESIIGKTAQWGEVEIFAADNIDNVDLKIFKGEKLLTSYEAKSKGELIADSLIKKGKLQRFIGKLDGFILSPRSVVKTNVKGKIVRGMGMDRIAMVDKFIAAFK